MATTIGSNTSSSIGIDVQATVDQIIYAERAPERLMQNQQQRLTTQAAALRGIQSGLSSLEDRINNLKDLSGTLNSRSATSSQISILTASANNAAASGIHSVVVNRLASSSSWYTSQLTNSTTTFAAGNGFNIQVGDGVVTTVTLDGTHNTLDAAAEYINGLDIGVSANVISDVNGSRLSLVSKSSGARGNIKITDDTTGLDFTNASQGLNAQLTVDGVPVESASNTINGVLAGVTMNVTTASPGTNVSVKVGPDTAKAIQSVNDFVSGYNAVINTLNSQFTYNPVTKQAGVLAADSTIRGLQERLLSDAAYAFDGNNGVGSLAAIGVNMNNDGTLTVDSAKLNDAVNNNYSDFLNFFQSSSNGFALHLGATMTELTDSVDGPITVDLNGVDATSKTISDQIDNFEVRLADREKQLLAQYSRIDTMLRQFAATQAQLTAQLGSLNSK